VGKGGTLNHSHLIVPGMSGAFFASMPHARTSPRSLYTMHVGILRKFSDEPGHDRICWIRPPFRRDEPYACPAVL
jgi:hypothetical protein